MTLNPGTRLGRYEIRARLGAGGMGEVYAAEDLDLGRRVALKLLPPDATSDALARSRLQREARAAATLDHPHICAVYDMGEAEGRRFIAMQYVEGETLDARIRSRRPSLGEALAIAADMADALAAAHARGVIHRDVKPSNVMLTPRGAAVVLDFGLAKLTSGDDSRRAEARTESVLSAPGVVMGTVPYMSPEQVRGETVDERSDIFSLGATLYEMLTGQRPFAGASTLATASAILTSEPVPLSSANPGIPAELERIVSKALRKNPDERYRSAGELLADLRALRDEHEFQRRLERSAPRAPAPPQTGWDDRAAELPQSSGRVAPPVPAVRMPGAGRRRGLVAAAVVAAAIAVLWLRGADDRWARDEALPALERLLREDQLFEAFVLAREIERRKPDHPALQRMWLEFTSPARIESDPPGAEVALQDYAAPNAPWLALGSTPVDLRLPEQPLRMRVTKAGFEPIESAPVPAGNDDRGRLVFAFHLDAAGTAPAGMVRVRGGAVAYRGSSAVTVEDFWIDRLEVQNRDYQRFVDEGGYRRPELWRHPVVGDDGHALEWDEAMARFRDTTGRVGPSTWELGRFPEGQDAHPVGGISWYEAAAYAQWTGKTLPTYHHWYRAALPDVFSQIVSQSHIGGDGTAAAGSLSGLGAWGTLDMAGNVKEWAWSATGDLRFALGGAWSDPAYLFAEPEAFSPLRRTPDLGLRCVKLAQPASAAALAAVERKQRDLAREPLVSDEVFAALASAYSYDRAAPLEAKIDAVDDSAPHWRIERVSLAAAYGQERLPVLLYLPKPARPPLTVVLYLPESTAESTPSSANIATRWFEFLLRGGRAVAVPVYKNMYERRLRGTSNRSPSRRRDLLIAWSKDLGRTIDYIATRPDLDSTRLAFYGFSLGAVYGPVLVALEPRIDTVVLLGGGVNDAALPPEADPVQFAPRVKVPTLMIAGRDDFVRPVERSQRPLFALLGAPAGKKRLAVLEGGHLPPRMTEVMREVLAWLDLWLGPAG